MANEALYDGDTGQALYHPTGGEALYGTAPTTISSTTASRKYGLGGGDRPYQAWSVVISEAEDEFDDAAWDDDTLSYIKSDQGTGWWYSSGFNWRNCGLYAGIMRFDTSSLNGETATKFGVTVDTLTASDASAWVYPSSSATWPSDDLTWLASATEIELTDTGLATAACSVTLDDYLYVFVLIDPWDPTEDTTYEFGLFQFTVDEDTITEAVLDNEVKIWT